MSMKLRRSFRTPGQLAEKVEDRKGREGMEYCIGCGVGVGAQHLDGCICIGCEGPGCGGTCTGCFRVGGERQPVAVPAPDAAAALETLRAAVMALPASSERAVVLECLDHCAIWLARAVASRGELVHA